MAWRSATIANSVAGCALYDLAEDSPFMEWGERDSAVPSCRREL
jgi:hypothetical protein